MLLQFSILLYTLLSVAVICCSCAPISSSYCGTSVRSPLSLIGKAAVSSPKQALFYMDALCMKPKVCDALYREAAAAGCCESLLKQHSLSPYLTPSKLSVYCQKYILTFHCSLSATKHKQVLFTPISSRLRPLQCSVMHSLKQSYARNFPTVLQNYPILHQDVWSNKTGQFAMQSATTPTTLTVITAVTAPKAFDTASKALASAAGDSYTDSKESALISTDTMRRISEKAITVTADVPTSLGKRSIVGGEDTVKIKQLTATSVTEKNEAVSAKKLTGKKSKTKQLCGNCGKSFKEGSRFCSRCGTAIKHGSETLNEFVNNNLLLMRKQEVGNHTLRVEQGIWKLILRHMGDVSLVDIASSHWEEYIRRMKERGCSPRTQALHQSTYQAAIKYAAFTGRIPKVHAFRPIKGTTKRTLKTVPFTSDEVHRLLNSSSSAMYKCMFGVCVGLGLRPSEVLRIQWEDFDFRKEIIRIRGTKTRSSWMSIPLTQLAKRELLEWWKISENPKRGLCFYKNRKVLNDTTVERKYINSFKKALLLTAKRAGVDKTEDGETRRVFPYILRHSFATIAATSIPPVPLPVAQAVMRHTSSKMLLETYAKAGAFVIKEGLKNFDL